MVTCTWSPINCRLQMSFTLVEVKCINYICVSPWTGALPWWEEVLLLVSDLQWGSWGPSQETGMFMFFFAYVFIFCLFACLLLFYRGILHAALIWNGFRGSIMVIHVCWFPQVWCHFLDFDIVMQTTIIFQMYLVLALHNLCESFMGVASRLKVFIDLFVFTISFFQTKVSLHVRNSVAVSSIPVSG